MNSGRVLGLDPGERRIGVALSDPGGIIAQPYVVIDRREGKAVLRIAEICIAEGVEVIVVGLPVSLSGREGAAVTAARKLGEEVKLVTGRNLVYWDERFTSVQAEKALLEAGMRRDKRRGTRDMIAAALMLQGYLDASEPGEP